MLAALQKAQPGALVLRHACAHNPAGVDLTQEQWRVIAALMKEKEIMPLMDSSCQDYARAISRSSNPRAPRCSCASRSRRTGSMSDQQQGNVLWYEVIGRFLGPDRRDQVGTVHKWKTIGRKEMRWIGLRMMR